MPVTSALILIVSFYFIKNNAHISCLVLNKLTLY